MSAKRRGPGRPKGYVDPATKPPRPTPGPPKPRAPKPTLDTGHKLTVAFTERPADIQYAADAAGCPMRTARQAWHEGLPSIGLPPLKRSFEDAKKAATALVRRTARERAAAEALDYARAAEDELKMLASARESTISTLEIAGELIPTMQGLVRGIAESWQCGPAGELPEDLTPSGALMALTRATAVLKSAMDAMAAVVTISRLRRGDSTENVAFVPGESDAPVPYEDAVCELQRIETVVRAAIEARGENNEIPDGEIVDQEGSP